MSRTKQFKFFVIDDDPFTIELLTGLLEAEGHEVQSSVSSTGVIPKIKAAQPDCVLTDLMMPGTDGMQLVKLIKEDFELAGTKVIVVSAKPFEFDRRQARRFGADAFVDKPIDADSFLRVVDRIMEDKIEVTFWGVRGTLPVAGQRSLRYGGSTSCVALSFPQGQFFIFDAGTGIKELSNSLAARNRLNLAAKIFISHPHWDHINALPFFAPLYIPGNEFEILGPVHANMSMQEMISAQMDDIFFPITIKEFGARVYFRDLGEEEFEIEGITVKTLLLSHPGNCLGYRVEYKGRSVCYITDNEVFLPDSPQHNPHYVDQLTAFLSETDALITDCTYTDDEYPAKVGWGQSCVGQVVDLAHGANVKTLYLVHHDPDQDDDAIDAKLKSAQDRLRSLESDTQCLAPAETQVIKV